jgi:hypothetical protein
MASISSIHEQLDALCCRVKGQVDALEPLEKVFAEHAERLRGHDQARCLDDLRERLIKEIGDAELSEKIAYCAYAQAKNEDGWLKFGLGVLEALLLRPQEYAAKRTAKKFVPVTPFDTIMIAIGAYGLPEDVHVFSISRYARDWDTSGLNVITRWEANGYRLYTQKAFFDILGKLRDEILQGKSRLPITQASIDTKLLPRPAYH